MNRFEAPRDLAPLDPAADSGRWERMVGGINLAAAVELQRRRVSPEPGILLLLSGWRRPAAAACTAIAAAAAAVLLLTPPAAEADGDLASALGYPETVAAWVESDSELSLEELLFSLEVAE